MESPTKTETTPSAFKRQLIIFLALAFVPALFIGVICIKVSVWRECRTDHSWFYCMELLGEK